MQIQNLITFIACDVSKRLNDHLHILGLTTSCQTGLKKMDTLGRALQWLIKHCMKESFNLRGFMTLDNIEIQVHIHNTQIEETIKLFHGSCRYLHFLPPCLIKDISTEEAIVESLLKCINKIQEHCFKPHSLLPNQYNKLNWKFVLKAQLFWSLLDYELKKNSLGYNSFQLSHATFPLISGPDCVSQSWSDDTKNDESLR